MRKKLKKLEKYNSLYEDLKIKDNERQMQEIEKKTKKELKR